MKTKIKAALREIVLATCKKIVCDDKTHFCEVSKNTQIGVKEVKLLKVWAKSKKESNDTQVFPESLRHCIQQWKPIDTCFHSLKQIP